ncbi:MAG: cytidylate kinase-like family protein [Acidobacteriaceae bacterium]|nr:cytidylate kinase-like family protein [Acidobacteriaceae bacterium]MBV9778946.1 cytidylate kinase-like family protein [Acidobacteriaceae bacterium]
MIRIITIEREYGSGAAAIAKKLSDQLGWTLWDRAITCEIARQLKCDVKSVEQREERPDPTFYRLVKIFMRGSYEESLQGGGRLELLDAEHLAQIFENIVTGIADRGDCIIIGRGSPWFLRNRDDTLRVFIYAPPEEKLRRLKAVGKSEREAEDLIQSVDRERAAFVKKYYGANWPERSLYHLMINSEPGDDAVIKMILTEMDLLNSKAGLPAGSSASQHLSR